LRLYHYPEGDSRAFCEALADYFGVSGRNVPASLASGGSPETRKGAYGKPYFSEPEYEGLFFSLSHTRGRVAVGFSDGELGVDCENIEARPGIESRYEGIARRCFTDDERAYVDGKAAGSLDAVGRFFEIWTAKEAYMKYTGRGFSEGWRSFSVFGLPGVRIETSRIEGAEHVVCSVCTQGADVREGRNGGRTYE